MKALYLIIPFAPLRRRDRRRPLRQARSARAGAHWVTILGVLLSFLVLVRRVRTTC